MSDSAESPKCASGRHTTVCDIASTPNGREETVTDAEHKAACSKPPKLLYKYRPLASCQDWDRLFLIIRDSKVYHPSPTKFNDPFDCKVPDLGSLELSFARYLIALRSATPEEVPRIYTEFCRPRLRTSEELVQLKAPLSEDETNEVNALLESIQERVNESTVFCLCAACNNILMWSHYASSHTGVCLKFSLKNWPEMAEALLPVCYSAQRIPLNITQSDFDNAQLVRAVNLTKHRSWSYEKEWRALGKKEGAYDFPPVALVGIIFGCMTSKADKARVKSAVEDRDYIKLYDAKPSKGAFALDISPAESP
jgi:hypothetical protein